MENQTETTKKEYSSPSLVIYGDLVDLTQGGSTGNKDVGYSGSPA